jgi:acetylornithine deacetylase/succinyl-diaminopimelate desuccinylase-like protein
MVHELLLAVGAESRMVQGSLGSNPLVLGRLGGWLPGAKIVCLHAHYDVQPPGDPSAWESPPFTLSGRDGFLYGRGTSDNKGPLLAMIFAAARYMRKHDGEGSAPVNFVFAFEGEGENGSAGFREAIMKNVHWFTGICLSD